MENHVGAANVRTEEHPNPSYETTKHAKSCKQIISNVDNDKIKVSRKALTPKGSLTPSTRARGSPLAVSSQKSPREKTATRRVAAEGERQHSPLANRALDARTGPHTPPRKSSTGSPSLRKSSSASSSSSSSSSSTKVGASVRYYNVNSPVRDYIRGKTSKVSSPVSVPSPPSLDNSPRSSPLKNQSQRISPGSSKYTSITSPVGQYIRGLSPTVQSPSRRPKSASAKPLHSAYAHSPRVTLGSVPASALTVSPFARNNRPKPSLAKVESPISSPLLTPRQHDDARLSGKTRLDRQELLLSPQAALPAQEAKEDHAAEDAHVVMTVPSPSLSSSSSHQFAKGTKPVLDLALEERHARHQSQQKEAEHERMVATQRQHVARVMATYAIARGRANAMGMLRTQAKAEAKRRASLEPPVCSEDKASSATSDAVMKGAMHEVVDHFVASDESHESAPEDLFAKHQSQVPSMDQDELVGLLFVKTPEDAATAGLCASRPLDARPVSPYECQLSPDSETVDEVSTLLAELECTTPGTWVVDSVEAQSNARGSKAIETEARAGQNEVKEEEQEEEAEVQEQEEDDDEEEEGLLSCRELAMPSSALNPKRIRISGTLKLKPLARTFSSAGGTTSAAWKAHWVVVHLNFLFIYRTQDSKRPLVVALLDSAEVEPVGNDAKRFMVRTRVGRKLFFEADSPQNAARWRKELGQSGYEHVRAAVAAGSPLVGRSSSLPNTLVVPPPSPRAVSGFSWDGELCSFSLCAVL